jgi:hypothetical protein
MASYDDEPKKGLKTQHRVGHDSLQSYVTIEAESSFFWIYVFFTPPTRGLKHMNGTVFESSKKNDVTFDTVVSWALQLGTKFHQYFPL